MNGSLPLRAAHACDSGGRSSLWLYLFPSDFALGVLYLVLQTTLGLADRAGVCLLVSVTGARTPWLTGAFPFWRWICLRFQQEEQWAVLQKVVKINSLGDRKGSKTCYLLNYSFKLFQGPGICCIDDYSNIIRNYLMELCIWRKICIFFQAVFFSRKWEELLYINK